MRRTDCEGVMTRGEMIRVSCLTQVWSLDSPQTGPVAAAPGAVSRPDWVQPTLDSQLGERA